MVLRRRRSGAGKRFVEANNNLFYALNENLHSYKPVGHQHVGEIDQEAIFYLRSRGLPQTEAFGLLIYAFAGEVLDRMSLLAVRQAMERLVLRHLPQGLVGHIH